MAKAVKKTTVKTDEDATRERHKANRAKKAEAIKKAKTLVYAFCYEEEFKDLPDELQNALLTLSKPTSRSGRTSDLFDELFPEVGTSIDELELFKKTKMGRSEFKRKVKDAILRAEAIERKWISFDDTTEEWTLVGVGAEPPEDYND